MKKRAELIIFSRFIKNFSKKSIKNVEVQEGRSSSILVLSKECFDAIFDCLSIEDVYAMGRTCKKMQRLAGDYFQRTYSGIEIINGIFDIQATLRPYQGFTGQYLQFSSFS